MRMLATIALALLGVVGCGSREETGGDLAPDPTPPFVQSLALGAAAEPSNSSTALFVRLAASATGVDHTNALDLAHPFRHTYVSGWVCGAVMVADFDGNGRPDLFFPQSAGPNQLYLQTAEPFRFREAAEQAGVDGGESFAAGGTSGDFDADGDIDLYLCNYDSPNQLFLNQGNNKQGIPTFSESAQEAGVNLSDASLDANLCDYDRDGDLDLFVLTHRYYHPEGFPEGDLYDVINGEPIIKPHLQKYYTATRNGKDVTVQISNRQNRLYRNDGLDGEAIPQFVDVTASSGIGEFHSPSYSATWFDFDDDGWLDLYIANDFEHSDRLFRNIGDGSFEDVIRETVPHTAYYSMGSAAADFDGDAREDVLVLDMAATSHYKAKIAMGALTPKQTFVLDNAEPRQLMRNALLLNTGTPRMMEAAYLAGIAQSDWSWTPLVADFDNDGRNDLLVTNGMARDFANADLGNRSTSQIGQSEWDQYADTPPRPEQNLALHNRGDLHFEDQSKAWGLDHTGISYAAAWADIDGDGHLDIIVSNLGEPPSIYHNQGAPGNRVSIRLYNPVGKNPHAIGARITLEAGGKKQIRSLQPSNGYLNNNQTIAHFGLGKDEVIDRLTILWPDGAQQAVRSLPANSHHTISRDPAARPPAPTPPPQTLFRAHPMLSGLVHQDRSFDDFSKQPLLPNRLSLQGPGHAWGDVDNDGQLDLFISQGTETADRLLLRRGDRMVTESLTPFNQYAAGETIAPLLIDVEGDGDLDLYLARGSYEFSANDPRQADLLFINDGSGEFAAAPLGAIPTALTVSGHSCAADYDRDGDLDIFVASRVTPGAYPTAPTSRLLTNNSTKTTPSFTEQAISELGMVTSAIWTDADADGWIDLLVATECGTLKFLHNDHGTLTDKTQGTGLEHYSGWWNSLTPCDVDRDGDLDYLAGNLGLNSKYHPTKEKPALIFYGDMDGTGIPRVVEAKSQKGNDRPLPVRGRS